MISNFAQVVSAIEKSLPKQCLRACHAVRNEWVKGQAQIGRAHV